MRNPTTLAFALSANSRSPKEATCFLPCRWLPASSQRRQKRPSPSSSVVGASSTALYSEHTPNGNNNENEKDLFSEARIQNGDEAEEEERTTQLGENDMMEFYEELGDFIVGQDELLLEKEDDEGLSEEIPLLLDDDREELLSLFEGIEEEQERAAVVHEEPRPILVDPPIYKAPFGKGGMSLLEQALLQGVVPISASVGSDCLPGDAGFDPFGLSSKDYIGRCQRFFRLLSGNASAGNESSRPSALILRDYREAEIRHGRLAMLAAIFWPLQEMFDNFLLDPEQFGGVLCHRTGSGWLFFPVLMGVSIVYLGYLDCRSQRIKSNKLGEAFLPGDCFWDPLKLLQGAPDTMKRNMQERELWNGRIAMMAVLSFAWEEVTTQTPLIEIASNQLLFEPAYEIPSFREWLDMKFETPSPTFTYPNVGTVDYVETYRDASTPPVENVPITDVDPETLLEEFAKQ